MVGNIKKGMLAGSQMLTEPKVTWRQGIGEAIVGAVDKAAQAKQQFDEREKNLVWSRLDLEAANLQAEELENIRTAGSIDDVLAIKKDFESKIKANMDGQKWGKEWIEQKGSSYFTANQNDVAKAFRAKEKELTGIEMDKTLTAYADAMANADEEQSEVLKQQAQNVINISDLHSPEEKHKMLKGLDDLVRTKRNDKIRLRKQLMAEEKLQFAGEIADLETQAIDGGLSRETLDIAKKRGVFKHEPDKYNKILNYMNKKDSDFLNDEETVKYIQDNWKDMTEEKLQQFNHEQKINNSTYNHYSAQLKKIKGGKGKDTEKAEIGKALLDRARAGEDVSADVTEYQATGQITTQQATAVLNEQKRIQGFSDVTKKAIDDIKSGVITEDVQITDLNLPNKEETTYLKSYLKEFSSAKTNKLKQAYEDLGRDIISGNIANEEVLRADADFSSFTPDQQENLLKGVRDAEKARVDEQYSDIESNILNNAIGSQTDLDSYLMSKGIILPEKKIEDLRKLVSTRQTSGNSFFDRALKFGLDRLPKGDSPAEVGAREKFREMIMEMYEKSLSENKSPYEIGEMLSDKNILRLANSVKPSVDDISNSTSDVFLNSAALKQKEDALFELVKSDKSGGKEELRIKNDVTLPKIIDYGVALDTSYKKGLIEYKDYNNKKSKWAKAMETKVIDIEKEGEGETVIGNFYSDIMKRLNPQSQDNLINLIDRGNIIADIAKQMTFWGMPLDLESKSIKDIISDNREMIDSAIKDINEGRDKSNKISEFAPYIITDKVLRNFALTREPNLPPTATYFNFGGSNIILNSLEVYSRQMDAEEIEKRKNKTIADNVVPGLQNPKKIGKSDMFDGMDEMNEEDQVQQKQSWSFFNN